jgi:flavoprotein
MTSSSVTASTDSKLSSSLLKIDTSSASTPVGRGLAVTQTVSAGSLLLCLDPLISVLDDSLMDKACSTCFSTAKSVDDATGKELFKCTGCGFLRYCSKVHLFYSRELTIRHVREKIGKFTIRENANIYNSTRICRRYYLEV